MEHRKADSTTDVSRKPYIQSSVPAACSTPHSRRPLSDIREITEPSLYEAIHRKPVGEAPKRRGPDRVENDVQLDGHQEGRNSRPLSQNRARSPVKSPESNPVDRSSVYSIAWENIPPRSSSKPPTHKRSTSINRVPAVLINQSASNVNYYTVQNQGISNSPLKEAASRLEPLQDSDRVARVPSKTIIKVESLGLADLLEHPTHLHPRLRVDLVVAAPVFVGGSSVEGAVRIIVDEAERVRHRKTLTLERVSIDLLGVEEVSVSRKHIFVALGNELIDISHPPPGRLVESQRPVTPLERSWILVPSIASLPFLIRLPLEVGPPPFQSKHARIRYVLCATLTIRDAGRQLCVRCSQEISVLSVYDPEKALVSLPSPLTASEEYVSSRGRSHGFVTVTAGLHRQVWVSGTSIFADVHVINNSNKNVKKLELQLERYILCYKHTAASTLEMSASQARIFSQSEVEIFARSTIKAGTNGWNGAIPKSTVLRTCELEIPRGHATIKCNKFFEYIAYVSGLYVDPLQSSKQLTNKDRKLVTVQLPLVLIHMNSLDVPTNSVAQVAAAIEEKRGGHCSPRVTAQGSPVLRRVMSRNLQGRAFNAPRMQSLDRARQHQANLDEVREILEASPRKYSPPAIIRKVKSSFGFKTPPSNRKGRIIHDDDANEIRRRFGYLRKVGSTITNGSASRNTAGPSDTNRQPPRASSALGFTSNPPSSRTPARAGRAQSRTPGAGWQNPTIVPGREYSLGLPRQPESAGVGRTSTESRGRAAAEDRQRPKFSKAVPKDDGDSEKIVVDENHNIYAGGAGTNANNSGDGRVGWFTRRPPADENSNSSLGML